MPTHTGARREGMVLVPGGPARLGSRRFYAEELTTREVVLPDLWFDEHPVTNAEFARFVEETGHVTVAEVAPDPADFPGADPELLVPGSQVFTPDPRTGGPARLDPVVALAARRLLARPAGAGILVDRDARPSRHARGLGGRDGVRRLGRQAPADRGRVGACRPRRASRGRTTPGGASCTRTAGCSRTPGSEPFPWRSDDPDGTTAPRRWAATRATTTACRHDRQRLGVDRHVVRADREQPDDRGAPCCGGATRHEVHETDRFVMKGGSHLCSPQYCQRYRPGSRQAHGVRDTTSHLGFRCVMAADASVL